METGSKPILRMVLPLAALAFAASATGQGIGVVLAHDVKLQSAALYRPGLPPAEAGGEEQAAAVPSAPLRPPAAATYAVWWVVMNNPGFCGGICGLDDLAAADLGHALFRAAGLGPEGAAPAQPPTREAAEEMPSENADDLCQPGECTELQRVTFLPFD